MHVLGREGEADRIVACMKTRHEAYLWRDVIQSRVDVPTGTGSGAGATASSSASDDALDAGDEASKGVGEGGASGVRAGGAMGSAIRPFEVGGRHSVRKGSVVSFVNGKVFPGLSLHLEDPLPFGMDVIGASGAAAAASNAMASAGGGLHGGGGRTKLALAPLSEDTFLLIFSNRVGTVFAQLGSRHRHGLGLHEAKVTFSRGGKVAALDVAVLPSGQFVLVYTEHGSQGRMVAMCGEALPQGTIAFGVPVEISREGVKDVAAAAVSNSRVAIAYTEDPEREAEREREREGSGGGGREGGRGGGACVVVLEVDPEHKHIDAPSKGCAARVGRVVDAIKLATIGGITGRARPSSAGGTGGAGGASAPLAAGSRVVLVYRNLVDRNAVAHTLSLRELSHEEVRLAAAKSEDLMERARGGREGKEGREGEGEGEGRGGGGKDGSLLRNSTQGASAARVPPSGVVGSPAELSGGKFVVEPIGSCPVHAHAARLSYLLVSPMAAGHVAVVFADTKSGGVVVLDARGTVPVPIAGPSLFTSAKPLSLSAAAIDPTTLLIGYFHASPKRNVLVKADVSYGAGGVGYGAGGGGGGGGGGGRGAPPSISFYDTVVSERMTTGGAVAGMGPSTFVYGFLGGSKGGEEGEDEEGGSKALNGLGGVVAGAYGHSVGVSTRDASPGSTLDVVLSGVSDLHSGLLPGNCYYGTTDGRVTTISNDNPVGLALSASELLLFVPSCAPA